MGISFFKPRKSFDFSPHPYDVGNLIGFWHNHDDNHFLLKLYSLDNPCFSDYYEYHLNYTLENKVGNAMEFFYHIWQITENRIKFYENKDPFLRNHASHKFIVKKLKEFQKYLNSIDQWNVRPSDIIIAEKEEVIQKLKQEIEALHARWDKVKRYEISQKIWIKQGYLPTVIDLFKQIEKLELPSGGNLLKYDHQVAYPRMISKYFAHAGNDIPIETLRNYYVVKKDDIPVKGTFIQPERKLFKIVPVKESKK